MTSRNNHMRRVSWLAPLACGAIGWLGVGCAKPEPPFPDAKSPDTAAAVPIDRFVDGFATLFNREAPVFNPGKLAGALPDANEPLDMDRDFLVHALGPAGEKVTYYALDISPPTPARAFTVHGVDGALIEGQLPILDTIPGDEGHSDFVHVLEIHVGDRYVANSLTSVAEIDEVLALGVAVMVDRGRVANWAMVPAGSTATHRFAGEPVSGFRGWKNGEVVHFLNFDRQLTQSPAGDTPASNVAVIFADGMSPTEGFATEADGVQTHNVVMTLPDDDDYSSLWLHQVGRLDGFDGVSDWPTAIANFQEKLDIAVNCPVVTE